jgi:SAM-dependent methyltransferase
VTATACPLCGSGRAAVVAASATPPLVRCRPCGLLYKDPLPAEFIRRHYDDVYTHDEVSSHIDRHRRALFERFLVAVPPFGGGRLLDVGCGTGEFPALARDHGWQAEGVEVSELGASLARRRGLVVHADAGALPDARFDAVTLWNVVDFFLRPVEQLRELHRVLAPGGLVFVRTPNAVFQLAAWRLSRVVVWPPSLARLVADAHFFQPLVWTAPTLRRLLLSAGFTDVRVDNSPLTHGDPYRASSATRERLVAGVKRLVESVAGGLYRASRGRVTVGPSLFALARRA